MKANKRVSNRAPLGLSGCLERDAAMSKQNRSANTVRTGTATVLTFVPRAAQLRVRGQRNYSRYMRLTKGFVKPDGPERSEWRKESAQEFPREAEWNERHGPIPGAAKTVAFPLSASSDGNAD